MSRRVLVHTDEILGERMAGPGIRAWRMAEALSGEQEVTLYSALSVSRGQAPDRLERDGFAIEDAGSASLDELLAASDVVIHQGGSLLNAAPQLRAPESEIVVVVDLYGAWILEQQEQMRVLDAPPDADRESASLALLVDHLQRADHLLCASSRQRELWIGHLIALGRVTAELYRSDPAFTDMITVVPFGLDGTIEPSSPRRVKNVIPGIAADDRVALWGGGIHDWFDPLTLIRAMAIVRETRPTARLLFLGTRHPNPSMPPMRMVSDARALAEELGLLGTTVIFNDGWVPVEERAGYFLDSDVGVSIHHRSLETEFSFRTRMLDFLWAGLPIVATEGDVFADTVSQRGLGAIVADGDVEGLARALDTMLFDEAARAETRARVEAVAHEFAWGETLAPVVALVGRARTAPGRLAEARRRAQARDAAAALSGRTADSVDALAAEREAALHQVNALRRELDDLRRSTSWRLTAPLRRLTSRRPSR